MKLKSLAPTILGISLAVLTACNSGKKEAPAEAAAKPAEEAAASTTTFTAETPTVDLQLPQENAATLDELFKLIPDVVATYGTDGNGKITAADLRKVLEPNVKIALEKGVPIAPDQFVAVAKRMTQNMAMEKILAEEAAKDGFKPKIQEATEQVQKIREQAGEEYAKQLAAQNTTEEELIKKLAEGLAIEAYLEKIADIKDEDIQKFYDDNKETIFTQRQASHILVKVEPDASDEDKAAAKKKLEDIQAKLADGADFAELAKAHSDCPSKEQGGDLGKFNRGQMVKPFEDALAELKSGEISKLVETQFGYHLIKAGDTTVAEFDDVKDGIRQNLFRNQVEEILKQIQENQIINVLIPDPAPATAPAGDAQ